MIRTRSVTLALLIAALTGAAAGTTTGLRAQQGDSLEHCALAERFLMTDRGMTVRVEPDTIQDWRTGRTLPGCRITAAGVTTGDPDAEPTRFYRRLMAAGWSRTPDPHDAQREGSLRFRRNGGAPEAGGAASDCLFNFYSAGHLGSPADLEVSSAVVPVSGESRYNVFVLCMPAMEAAARSGSGGAP